MVTIRLAQPTAGHAISVLLTAAFVLLFTPICAHGQSTDKQSTDTLHKLNESVDALIRKVSPSVVQILVTGYGPIEQDRSSTAAVIGRQRAIGSGFVIDPDGYIITNAHVVSGAQRVEVVLPENADSSVETILAARTRIVAARVLGVARQMDLALIKIDDVKLPALRIASYRSVRQGQVVLAFGSPEGLRNSVTLGVVSSVARQTDPDSPLVYIQTDAPINPGNSGGPLINVDGEVIGVNTFILSQSGGNEGLGFAIPSGVVSVVYQQLRKFGHIHRTEVGVGLQSISPTLAAALKLSRSYGVIVSDVLPDGPAAASGVMIGDILVTVDGYMADSVPYVAFRLMSIHPGDKVRLEVLRGNDHLSFDVPVIEHTDNMDQVTALANPEKALVIPLGILGVEVDKEIADMLPVRDPFGIIVAARSNTGGSEVPLAVGDVIRTLNGERMATVEQLRAALKALPSGSPVVLQIQRDQQLQFIAFTLDQSE